jgi:hypothetical protein
MLTFFTQKLSHQRLVIINTRLKANSLDLEDKKVKRKLDTIELKRREVIEVWIS